MKTTLSLIAVFCIALLACALTTTHAAPGYSTIDAIVSHQDRTVSTFFQGELYCELGCDFGDVFSYISLTTTASVQVKEVQIVFYNETTGQSLIILPPTRDVLTIECQDNAIDGFEIPWSDPIPPNTRVPFRGTIEYNFIPQQQQIVGSSRFSYLPTNPQATPQNMYFETRIAERAAAYSNIYAFFDKDYATEGKLYISFDDAQTEINAIQIRLVGSYRWLTATSRGCSINGGPQVHTILNADKTIMTFVAPAVIEKGREISLSCLEPLLQPRLSQTSTLKQITHAQVSLIPTTESYYSLADHRFVYTRVILPAIEPDVPTITTSTTLYGDMLVSQMAYQFLKTTLDRNTKDAVQFQITPAIANLVNVEKAHARVTNSEDQTIIYGSYIYPIEKAQKFAKTPLALTVQKDTAPLDAQLWVSVGLRYDLTAPGVNGTVGAKMDYYHGNLQDPSCVYSAVSDAKVHPKAAQIMQFNFATLTDGNGNQNKHGFTLDFANFFHSFDTLLLKTTSFDAIFEGGLANCYATEVQYDAEAEKFTPKHHEKIHVSTTGSASNAVQIGLTFKQPLAKATSYRLACPDVKYIVPRASTLDEESMAADVKAQHPQTTTTLVAIFSTQEQQTATRYANGATVKAYNADDSTASSHVAKILIAIGVVCLLFVVGFFGWRWYAHHRQEKGEGYQMQLLSDDDSQHFVIQ